MSHPAWVDTILEAAMSSAGGLRRVLVLCRTQPQIREVMRGLVLPKGNTAMRRLVEDVRLQGYVSQLEGYARAVNTAFRSDPKRSENRVVRCALWFVRTGAMIQWEV